jgi:hypothetical protein
LAGTKYPAGKGKGMAAFTMPDTAIKREIRKIFMAFFITITTNK